MNGRDWVLVPRVNRICRSDWQSDRRADGVPLRPTHNLKRHAVLVAAAISLATLAAGFAEPCRADPQRGPTLEEQLLDDLESDPMDEDVHRELFGREKEKAPPAVSEDDHPLVDVARKMRSVQGRIGRADSGQGTQNLQKDIVARLEELLKQARSRCSGGQPKPSPNQQKVAARRPVNQPKQQRKPSKGGRKPGAKAPRDPQTTPGTSAARHPDMDEMRDLMKAVWGELPPGQREQMLELPVEEFLPKYEVLIEAYFKRLAEEQQEADQWPANNFPAP